MNNVTKLLDAGLAVTIFKNPLGSYTALAVPSDHEAMRVIVEDADSKHLTDDFTPENALSRIADKVNRLGDYQPGGRLDGLTSEDGSY